MFLRLGGVRSHAAESALVDAYSFSGGPRPCHGFVLAVVLLVFGGFVLVVVEFVRFVVMLLMFMMLLMSSCTVMHLLLLCLI